METSYEAFDAPKVNRTNKITLALLILTCILFIIMCIAVGILASKINDNDNSSSSVSYCTTSDCLQLAADLSKTINTSVDPCHDFYHYVCDGWDDENSWNNIDSDTFGQFNIVVKEEMNAFLDELFYNTNPELVDFSSVRKATTFFQTCYDSILDVETAKQSVYIQRLITNTTFYSSNTWDNNEKTKFQSALRYLNTIGSNPFFSFNVASTKTPLFTQDIMFWYTSAQTIANFTIDFVPLYQQYFNLNLTQSYQIATKVMILWNSLFNITTIFTDPNYPISDAVNNIMKILKQGIFSNMTAILGSNPIGLIDYKQLVYDTYGISSTDNSLKYFKYIPQDTNYFKQLGSVLEAQEPKIVQYYIWSTVLHYFLNFQNTYSQTRFSDRTAFCFHSTKNTFPFVYGYVLFNTLYNNKKDKLAETLTDYILNYGTKTLIQQSEWLDEASRAAALKKVNNMKTYVGYPPRLEFGENIDKYYECVEQLKSVDWINNIEAMATFTFQKSNETFWGQGYNLTAGWPSDFESQSEFGSWLTGVNAFYMPLGNWFTIPVSISQKPFLIASEGYPSCMTFGGLGAVCGHEMSHGFDPQGSEYNYNGTNVGSIFTNSSQILYTEEMSCFKKQYNRIMVDNVNGTVIYDNGTRTITENVADNAGVQSSWVAWKQYIEDNGDDKSLYGVDFSHEQLFFIGFAQLWCETKTDGAYKTYDDVHSPNYARVIGALQNHPHFADAFGCKTGDRMNPNNKCVVW